MPQRFDTVCNSRWAAKNKLWQEKKKDRGSVDTDFLANMMLKAYDMHVDLCIP